MLRAFYLIALCLLFLFQFADGQVTKNRKTAKTASKSAVIKAEDYPNLKIQAEETGNATVVGDFAKLADFTYPQIVTAFGGKQKMVEFLRNDSAKMKASGFELENATIGEIQQIAKIDAQIFAIVPIKLTIKSPNGKFVGESSMVGISSDRGANWKFINGVSQEKFDKQFPRAAGKLQIPTDQPPRPIENE